VLAVEATRDPPTVMAGARLVTMPEWRPDVQATSTTASAAAIVVALTVTARIAGSLGLTVSPA